MSSAGGGGDDGEISAGGGDDGDGVATWLPVRILWYTFYRWLTVCHLMSCCRCGIHICCATCFEDIKKHEYIQ